MNKTQSDYLITACMFLEMVFDECEPPIASDDELVWAAHSYIQAARHETEPDEPSQLLLAKILATVALEDAMRKPTKGD